MTFTREQAARLTAGRAMWATAEAPGVPSLAMADGPMGIASGRVDERDVATLTPCPTALGASWDIDLVRRVGAVVGQEAARSGVDMVLAPNLNLARSPLAGRSFEFFSEDPYLTGALGCAWITGLQAQGTGSVTKHLVCNDSETDRDTMNAVVSEQALREVYLLPFEMAAEAKCAGFLMAYNRVNGQHCVEHAPLLSIIKDDWSFDGFTVSDWFGLKHGLSSAHAGLDLEMPGPRRHMGDLLAESDVPDARLQDAASRVARAAGRWSGAKAPVMAEDARQAILTEAAAAGFVLLKNHGDLLPLDPKRHRRVAIIGPNATAPCFQGGTFAKIAIDPATPTPLDALRRHLGDRFDIVYEPGVSAEPRLPDFPVTPVEDLGDGVRGFTVSYYGDHSFSAPVARETRDSNSLTWFANTGIKAVVDQDAAIRASGYYTPAMAGTHRLFVGGTGSVRVRIDGIHVFERELELKPGDVMGRLKSGDADSFDHDFATLEPVRIEIDLVYTKGRVQGLWYGIEGPDQAEAMLERAVECAAGADIVVLMVGETSDSSVESKDRATTDLSQRQIRLIEAITAVNRRTVVVANVGHGLDTVWDRLCDGLLLTFYPGQCFAQALAEVLGGEREPGGRLPITLARQDDDYPAYDLTPEQSGDLAYNEGDRIGYRYFTAKGLAPRYGLGAGQGYAAFQMGEAACNDEGSYMSVTVTNTGLRAGKCVLQVYADTGRGYQVLAGFATAWIEAGTSGEMTIPLSHKPLRTWTAKGWQAPAGPVQFWVGQSIDKLERVVTIFTSPYVRRA